MDLRDMTDEELQTFREQMLANAHHDDGGSIAAREARKAHAEQLRREGVRAR